MVKIPWMSFIYTCKNKTICTRSAFAQLKMSVINSILKFMCFIVKHYLYRTLDKIRLWIYFVRYQQCGTYFYYFWIQKLIFYIGYFHNQAETHCNTVVKINDDKTKNVYLRISWFAFMLLKYEILIDGQKDEHFAEI